MSDTPLRILVVLPMYGGSLPIGKYCVEALRELGQSVRVFDAQYLYPAFTGLKKLDISPSQRQPLEKSFLRLVSQAVWTLVLEQKPRIVLALAQAPLDKNLLQRLKKEGIRTVMWFVEDFQVFTYWKLYAPLYDAFAVIQKEPFLSELAAIGQKHAFYLPLAALPAKHKKLNLTKAELKEYGSEISFLGAGYPNRRLAFRPLADRDFKIWGSDWDDEDILARNIQRKGARIDEDESVKIYNAAKININLHSSIKPDTIVGNGDFVNPRTFELAAIGAFQLVDKRGLMAELFEPEELATFTSGSEFMEAIDYFSRHPQEREKYAKAAQKRVLRDHTYQKRMATLLNYMEKTFGPLAEASSGQKSAKPVDPGMEEQLRKVMARLGLAPDAPFREVVARLRRQSGELDEIETAILFLDEWRKQYSG